MDVTQRSAGRTSKLPGVLVVLVLAAAALAGCGGSTQPSGSSGDGSGQGGPFPRTVNHAMGTTTIDQQPQRVVSLDRTFTDATLTLDTEVIGFTTFTAGVSQLPSYLRKAGGENLSDAQPVGTLSEPNVEKIARLQPDLILSAKVRHQSIHDELSKIAPTVFSQDVGTWKKNLRLVGRALGKQQMAKSKLQAYQKRAQATGDAIRTKLGTNPTATLARFAGERTVRLYTRNSYPGEVIYADVGLARPKDAPTSEGIKVDLSQERIRELDADHIFVATYQGQTGEAAQVQKKFRQNPLWSRLQDEIHTVKDTTWYTAVGLQGAQAMVGDLTEIFGVDPGGSAG